MVRHRVAGALAVLAASLSSCAKREVPIVEVKGECGDLFKAHAGAMLQTVGQPGRNDLRGLRTDRRRATAEVLQQSSQSTGVMAEPLDDVGQRQ